MLSTDCQMLAPPSKPLPLILGGHCATVALFRFEIAVSSLFLEATAGYSYMLDFDIPVI